ncbi:MAG: hypothetical protein Q9166_003602 [cf. Caloplaca sp. 2 TL-2023]
MPQSNSSPGNQSTASIHVYVSLSPYLTVIGQFAQRCLTVLGYFVVLLVWAGLLWSWVLSPATKLVQSLAKFMDQIANTISSIFRKPLSVTTLLGGLLYRDLMRVLEFVRWMYSLPIDRDIDEEEEESNASSMNWMRRSSSKKESSVRRRLRQDYKITVENKAKEPDECPWNDSDLWSHIPSEANQDQDERARADPIAPDAHSQALQSYDNPTSMVSSAFMIGSLGIPVPPDPNQNRDSLTLRDRCIGQPQCSSSNQGTTPYPSTYTQHRQYSQPSPQKVLSTNDYIEKLQQMKAKRDREQLSSTDMLERLGESINPSAVSSKCSKAKPKPHPQDRRVSDVWPENIQHCSDSDRESEAPSTPALDHDDGFCPSSSDEVSPTMSEPLVSLAIPGDQSPDRWAAVFSQRAESEADELDRFEAAL